MGRYVLDDLGDLALLDLPDTSLEALAFLEASFPVGGALPEHAYIHEVLDRVAKLLPAARREQRHRRATLRLHSVGQAPGKIDTTVLSKLRRAVEHAQEITFDYISTFDDASRRHRVAPYTVFFQPEGHGYLDATLLEVVPSGNEMIHAAINYRLDRIVAGSVQILPTKLPPQRVSPPTYKLCYRLLPIVARRRDVASYFPETQFEYHDDGSATVTATVTNLWQARQILLRYGTACRVLEPPELVELFRSTAQGMAQMYLAEPTT
jgi:predicted DNA-binding transcriptional regulator YafY